MASQYWLTLNQVTVEGVVVKAGKQWCQNPVNIFLIMSSYATSCYHLLKSVAGGYHLLGAKQDYAGPSGQAGHVNLPTRSGIGFVCILSNPFAGKNIRLYYLCITHVAVMKSERILSFI